MCTQCMPKYGAVRPAGSQVRACLRVGLWCPALIHPFINLIKQINLIKS